MTDSNIIYVYIYTYIYIHIYNYDYIFIYIYMHIVTNPTKQIIPLGNISNYRYCPISLLVYAHLFWSSQDMSSPMTPFSITGFKAMGRAQEAEFQHYW